MESKWECIKDLCDRLEDEYENGCFKLAGDLAEEIDRVIYEIYGYTGNEFSDGAVKDAYNIVNKEGRKESAVNFLIRDTDACIPCSETNVPKLEDCKDKCLFAKEAGACFSDEESLVSRFLYMFHEGKRRKNKGLRYDR